MDILYFQVTAGLASTYIDGRRDNGPNGGPNGPADDFEDFPPPPPELLQQQYLYGAAPQQGVYANVAPGTQSQGVATYHPGKGTTDLPPPQKGSVSTIPVSTTPIQVEKRSVQVTYAQHSILPIRLPPYIDHFFQQKVKLFLVYILPQQYKHTISVCKYE